MNQGLQHKTIEEIHEEFPDVPVSQLLALFNRSLRKFEKLISVLGSSILFISLGYIE